LDAPATVASQRDTNAVAEELSAGNGNRLDGNERTAETGRRQFADIQGSDGGSCTDSETENDTTDDDLWDRIRWADENSTDDKVDVADTKNPFAADSVGQGACD
jgi:hypothetical protein